MQRRLIVRNPRDDDRQYVAGDARDVAIRLGRLIETVELPPVDGDAGAEQHRPIDEDAVLAARCLSDGPVGDMSHGGR